MWWAGQITGKNGGLTSVLLIVKGTHALTVLSVGSKNILEKITINERVAKNKNTSKQQIERGQKANNKLIRRLNTNKRQIEKLRTEGLALRAQINNI